MSQFSPSGTRNRRCFFIARKNVNRQPFSYVSSSYYSTPEALAGLPRRLQLAADCCPEECAQIMLRLGSLCQPWFLLLRRACCYWSPNLAYGLLPRRRSLGRLDAFTASCGMWPRECCPEELREAKIGSPRLLHIFFCQACFLLFCQGPILGYRTYLTDGCFDGLNGFLLELPWLAIAGEEMLGRLRKQVFY